MFQEAMKLVQGFIPTFVMSGMFFTTISKVRIHFLNFLMINQPSRLPLT